MSMLKAHMDAVENQLVVTSQIPSNAGHTLHKGTPREAFIKTYLEGHLGANVAIGSGEIIDASSKPGDPRRQYDIIVYRENYPKLDFGGGINGFLIESVIATIEVKSILDQAGIDQAVGAAYEAKSLVANHKASLQFGWAPPKVLNYVIAYTGAAQMQTVYGWIMNSHRNLGIPLPSWTQQNKADIPGTALDGVFVLHKGFVVLDNTLLTLNGKGISGTHVISDSANGNLLQFFLLLQMACANLNQQVLNPLPYISNVGYSFKIL